MSFDKTHYFKVFLIFIIITSYFFGFTLRENLSGGAESDFINFTWPAIQGFQNDFLDSIKNYGKFHEGAWPMFHILNAYLNPFTFSEIAFQFSITIISILNFFIFENIVRNKFQINRVDSFLLSSIILLLPIFRSSAFWGLTENFGWLFLLIAIKIYLKIEDYLDKKILNKKVLINILFLCLFSSFALYTRQYLIFFSIFLILDLIFIKKNLKALTIFLVFFSFFSIPGFILIYLWGGLYDSANFTMVFSYGPTDDLFDYHHPKFIVKNLPFLFSFFALYLMPFFFIEMKTFGFFKIIKKYFPSFIIVFLIMNFFNFFDFLEYLKSIDTGGGAILKLNYILFKNNIIFFILFVSIGFSLFYEILKQNFKFNTILFLTLLVFCLPYIILQEYYEPLILFAVFLLFHHNYDFLFDKKNNFSILIIVLYYAGYLIGSIYYRYFFFTNIEDWKIFIEG